ncbi:hypothetical protein ANAEL_04207 [Anaerolineales bacterium]|nr:hypothetical protein ANAEL_04207 [Anaerolineales bacterium]
MELLSLRVLGILAFIGALLYSVGDILLLASKIKPDEYPNLKPFAKLLSGSEKMAVLSPARMMWGALIGVFATPLILLGFWQVYQGLSGMNAWATLTTFSLFASASIIGAFVHGSFFYLGEYVRALNNVSGNSREIIAGMLERHKKILMITYAPLLIFVIAASILFSVLVASGKTAFPVWMAGVTPLTVVIVWLMGKRIPPRFIRDWTEGAGFSIAYMAFFACTTITLWNG